MVEFFKKLSVKNEAISLYFAALLGILTFIYYPTFFNAPRSDWWETLYFFHTIYASPLPFQWLDILNTDCILHVSFRPLSHLILYFQHFIFGANFFYIHLINFSLYCGSLVLLYKLAVSFVNQKRLAFISVVFFSLLYSHFDIVSWTAHSYLILGFCLSLLGFLSYIGFLNTGSGKPLFWAGFLLLSGMLCYEAFVFWPLAIVFLASIGSLINRQKVTAAQLRLSCLSVIGATYCIYILIFFLTRNINTYTDSGSQTHALILQLLTLPRFYRTALAVFFDIAYNGILVNILPVIAYPPQVSFPSFNILLGGFLGAHRPAITDMHSVSIIFLLLISWAMFYLAKRKKIEVIKKFIFLFFLLFTFSFTVFISKYFSNREYGYSLFQFRYHYVPSAFLVLIFLLFFAQAIKLKPKIKIILGAILAFILILNIRCIMRSVALETRQLAPLNIMLANIKEGIKSKQLNQDNKLYIDNRIADILPKMCWNPVIGKLMQGTYQWVFNKEEMKYFSNTPQDAAWFIDPRDFNLSRQPMEDAFGGLKKTGLGEDSDIISPVQCQDYIDLGNSYYKDGRLEQAEKIFVKVLRIDSEDEGVYISLGDIYRKQGDILKAKEMFQMAIQVSPENENGYLSLGDLYRLGGEYAQADRMYQQSLKINPDNANTYDSLGTLYAMQGKHRAAVKMYKKALKLNPGNAIFYDGLAGSYASQGKYSEGEQMHKKAVALSPGRDIFYANFGHFYNNQNKCREAADMYKQALKINPANIEVINALEDCYRRQDEE
ncbi:MAG: tetratricopeptide repeat protein [Candidatus Omnitrophica bacterium]|nr:tetratricopeptide repeat protein [Candidatus Omnitrophota bacterium]